MSEALVKAEPKAAHALEPRTAQDAYALAEIIARSNMFAAKRPEEAMVVILTGRELGLTAMQSLRSIHMIEGKPTLSADLMAARVRSSPLCAEWQIVKTDNESCVIRVQRDDDEQPTTFSFSMEDAKRAELLGKTNWKKYPANMLRARCTANAARAMFPELLMGIYDPDELSAPVQAPAEQVANEPQPVAEPPAEDVWPKRIREAKTLTALDKIVIAIDKLATEWATTEGRRATIEQYRAAIALRRDQLINGGHKTILETPESERPKGRDRDE